MLVQESLADTGTLGYRGNTASPVVQLGEDLDCGGNDLPSALVTPAKRLAIILRLAVLLHRGRDDEPDPDLTISVSSQQVRLSLARGWLISKPLTHADLRQEQSWLKTIGIKLQFD